MGADYRSHRARLIVSLGAAVSSRPSSVRTRSRELPGHEHRAIVRHCTAFRRVVRKLVPNRLRAAAAAASSLVASAPKAGVARGLDA